MWLRNIIWFILLTGIIIVSVLLFLLIMDPAPAPNYTTSTPTANTPETQITHDKSTTVSPQVQTTEPLAGNNNGGGWIAFGRYFGFLPLILLVFPIIKLFKNRQREFLPFFAGTLLFVCLASIHGALLLRFLQPFSPSFITGFLLYLLSLLFLLRWAILLFSRQKITGQKIWIPLGILLLFILVHLFW